MVTPFQLVAILFAAFMIFITYKMVKAKRFDIKGALLWFVLWGGLVIGILFFQQVSQFSTSYLGIEPQDLFIFVAIFALFWMMFQHNLKFEEHQKHIDEITTEFAHRDAKKR